MLIESCLSSLVKFGCEMWDDLAEKDVKEIDNLKVKVIKRVLELPYSTPSAAVKYEFGLLDFSLEILMEKVLLAVKVLKSDDNRIAKQLLKLCLQKNVPGFCRQVLSICSNTFGCQLEALVEFEGDLRAMLREKLLQIQRDRLRTQMMTQSKTDGLLMNAFSFDGQMKCYFKLPFKYARMIFMVRCRMVLVKDNFPGRWVRSLCNVCR